MMKYDIVIVGGGIVGLTLATMLAQETTLSIALLENKKAISDWSIQQYHHRVSAITLASKQIFQHLDIWPALKEKRISPFKAISVWHHDTNLPLHFNSKDIGASHLGYIIENNLLQKSLLEKLLSYPQVNIYYSVQLNNLHQTHDEITLITADGRRLSAKLAIAADGAHSWLRKQAHIAVTKYDYEQTAVVSTVTTSLAHTQIARQVFLKTGPLAFLPLANANLSSIVWTLPKESAHSYREMDEQTFKNQLAQSFAHRLGEITHIADRYTFPLYRQQAKHYVKSRIVLVGDAAHTVHPLAGLGVNIGLMDAATLLDVIIAAEQERGDFSHSYCLRRYERHRRAESATFMQGIDMVKQVFSQTQFPLQSLLSYGLRMSNHLPVLKNFFSRLATGKRKGLPRLANTI